MKTITYVVLVCGLCVVSYLLGRSHATIKEVEKRVEVIKYVEKQKAAIHAKPNASRDELLSLMRAGKF